MSTITDTVLNVSDDIPSGTDNEVADPITPPNGALEVWLIYFEGNAAGTVNSKVEVVNDYDETGEKPVDSTKGDKISKMHILIPGPWDGVKKVALVCSNGETETITMSGKAIIRVKTT